VMDAGVRLHGAADHGVSESVYLADPDGNGIELTVDRPREAWRYEDDGSVVMTTGPLDLRALLEEAALPSTDTPQPQ
jgi:catechol 2,3-dioxygenase